jgi:hypothetical protein
MELRTRSARSPFKSVSGWALALAVSFVAVACSKSRENETKFADPTAVRLSPAPGRPEMEMAFAAAAGKPVPSPDVVGGALLRALKPCPEADALGKNGSMVRFRLSVQGDVIHAPKEAPTDPIALCLSRAIDGAPFPGSGAEEFAALAEIRATQK